MIFYNVGKMRTKIATIRYVAYRDEYLLKDPERKVYVPRRAMEFAVKHDGYINVYDEAATDILYFFDRYRITQEMVKRLSKKHRKVETRIIVLAKRSKEM